MTVIELLESRAERAPDDVALTCALSPARQALVAN
jgi:hypothetical protein